MSGCLNSTAAKIQEEVPAALSVHFLHTELIYVYNQWDSSVLLFEMLLTM